MDGWKPRLGQSQSALGVIQYASEVAADVFPNHVHCDLLVFLLMFCLYPLLPQGLWIYQWFTFRSHSFNTTIHMLFLLTRIHVILLNIVIAYPCFNAFSIIPSSVWPFLVSLSVSHPFPCVAVELAHYYYYYDNYMIWW